jgi:tetratricopeptide (TPR) repeat protein
MKRIWWILLCCLFLIPKGHACINYFYSIDKEGHLYPVGYEWKYPFHINFEEEWNVNRLHKLETKLRKEKSYGLLSDYAVCLLKLGKRQEALELFLRLYRYYPADYKIAANLGTAYELMGQPDSALKYILRDIALNPQDHEGSEWIHVKVLQTEIALRANNSYLTTHTVLELTSGQQRDTAVFRQLLVQLQERVPFCPGPNQLMASLFTDLGNLSATLKSVEYARVYYQIAQEYYGDQSLALTAKIKNMQKLINKYAHIEPPDDSTFEGSRTKIGYMRYSEFLLDHSDPHFHPDWTKINTQVASLLALVDFTKTAQQIKDSAKVAGHANDELMLIPEATGKLPGKQDFSKADSADSCNMKIVFSLLGIVGVGGMGYWLVRRGRKR